MNMFKKFSPIWFAVMFIWVKTVLVSFIGFNLSAENWLDALFMIFSPIGTIMVILGMGFYFKKKIKPAAIFLTMVILTGILYGDLLYYRFYTDFVTVPILFQFKNVGGLGPSTLELISPWDLLLFADLILFLLISKKENVKPITVSNRVKKVYAGVAAILVAGTVGLGMIKVPHLFSESYNRQQLVKNIGLYQYHLFDIGVAASQPLNRAFATASDAEASAEYVEAKEEKTSDYFGAAKGMNVVLISMESTQNFVINEKAGGQEITPFLNSLIKESFYFSNVYDQTAQGKTSDSEFMIDTGLYPLSSGSAFVRKTDNTYKSLPEILSAENNYYAAVFHGNDASFWNRESMYESLGYDRYFSKADYWVTNENSVNYGIKDIPFFQQSLPYLEEIQKPFYARFITLTNHFPFLLEEKDQFIYEANTSEMVVNRYVTTVRYQDEAIKTFFQELKDKGLYDNTMFVLYGDHYGISDKYEHGVLELLNQEDTLVNRMKLQSVPVIIHVPGVEGNTFSNIGGEVDIRATVLHLLGIEPEENFSFAHNLFTRDPNHPVVFRDGSFIAADYLYKAGRCFRQDNEEEVDIHECEPSMEIVRKELGLSDDIVNGDLLRFLE
ncbi:LTA synthase family protein [Bacillus sp. ISL-47]|uniref:LTA synthase family protein n=1 Tax=Bacillus sp. ISL-47 TaxID=2819130 RepID=UPI001BEC24B5|nr:LTA synthase family protein [Bacillus sp. ISL-47]MBT2686621.1 LTA synthase family protein [Bacillus sp. ISL-47]MBT2707013.1 LTA synthase family protein [Pseudomonas sp. ISL-84]